MSGRKDSLRNKYFIRRNADDYWDDVTEKFDGVKILSISGFDDVGDAVNVFTQQWVESQREDMMVTTQDDEGNDVIIRENVDLSLTFIVGARYSSCGRADTQYVYDCFRDYICNHGSFQLMSAYYNNKVVDVVCLKGFSPTTVKLNRGVNSYILATATLHCIDAPRCCCEID